MKRKTSDMNDYFGTTHTREAKGPIAPLPFDITLGYIANKVDFKQGIIPPNNLLNNPISTNNNVDPMYIDINPTMTKIAEVAPTPDYVLKQVERKREQEQAQRAEELLQKQQEEYNAMLQNYDQSIENSYPGMIEQDMQAQAQAQAQSEGHQYAASQVQEENWAQSAQYSTLEEMYQYPKSSSYSYASPSRDYNYPDSHYPLKAETTRVQKQYSSGTQLPPVLNIIQSLQRETFTVYPQTNAGQTPTTTLALAREMPMPPPIPQNHPWQHRNPFISEDMNRMEKMTPPPPTATESQANSNPAASSDPPPLTSAPAPTEQLSEAQRQRRQFLRFVTPENQDAALQLWKDAKRLEKSEGLEFDWESGPWIVFEQVADATRDRDSEGHFQNLKKEFVRKSLPADLAVAFLLRGKKFSVKSIVLKALEENKAAIKQEFVEKPPPPPTIPTRAILKECVWETFQEVVNSLDSKSQSDGSGGGGGRMSSGVGGAAGNKSSQVDEDASLLGQWAKAGFKFLRQWIGPKSRQNEEQAQAPMEAGAAPRAALPVVMTSPTPPAPSQSEVDALIKETELVFQDFNEAVQVSRQASRVTSPLSAASSLGAIAGLSTKTVANEEETTTIAPDMEDDSNFDAVINTSQLLERRKEANAHAFPNLTINPIEQSGGIILMMDSLMEQCVKNVQEEEKSPVVVKSTITRAQNPFDKYRNQEPHLSES